MSIAGTIVNKKEKDRSSMSREIVSRYMWVEESYWQAACVTFVRGASVDEVMDRFGGDPDTAEWMTLREAVDSSASSDYADDDCQIILADAVGEWVVVVEENGFQATLPEVVKKVSTGAQMVSVFWNVNSDSQFTYAVNGQVITTFDLVFPEERSGSDPDYLLEPMSKLLLISEDQTLTFAFALAESITGVRFEQDWLEEKHRVVFIPPI
jgi:hypothetical protein